MGVLTRCGGNLRPTRFSKHAARPMFWLARRWPTQCCICTARCSKVNTEANSHRGNHAMGATTDRGQTTRRSPPSAWVTIAPPHPMRQGPRRSGLCPRCVACVACVGTAPSSPPTWGALPRCCCSHRRRPVAMAGRRGARATQSREAARCELLSARLGRLDLSRHNISRIPELDFFVRKLARDREEALWDLPYSKAGAAAALPERFASAKDFLSQMQAHTALEFQVWRRRRAWWPATSCRRRGSAQSARFWNPPASSSPPSTPPPAWCQS